MKQEASGHLFLKGWQHLALFGGAQWQAKRQWTQTGTEEMLSEHQETLKVFLWEWSSTSTGCPEFPSWGTVKGSMCVVLDNLLCEVLLEQEGWTRCEVPSQLNYYVWLLWPSLFLGLCKRTVLFESIFWLESKSSFVTCQKIIQNWIFLFILIPDYGNLLSAYAGWIRLLQVHSVFLLHEDLL